MPAARKTRRPGRTAPAALRRRSTSSPVIDFHAHLYLPEVGDYVRQNRAPGSTEARLVDGFLHGDAARRRQVAHHGPSALQARLADMDESGIDMQVVSCHASQYGYWAPVADGTRLARLGNDRIAEFVGRYPNRFIGMGMVPLQDTQAAIVELERAVNALALSAIVVDSHVDGVELGDARLQPFWMRAEQLRVPIFVHPSGFQHPRFDKHLLWSSAGRPIEAAIAMSSLIYEGVLERFPRLKFGIAHGGGFLPYTAGRADRSFRGRPDETPGIRHEPSRDLKRFFFDSCVDDRATLEFLVHKVGAERIVLGGNYPLGDERAADLVKKAKLSPAAKRMILGENAARILGVRL